MRTLKTLIDGSRFREGPRWHDGKILFLRHARASGDRGGYGGQARGRLRGADNRPSGLGWLPDGRMLVVSMTDRKLMRLDRGGLKMPRGS